MLWKRLRVLGSVAHYHPKCQSGTSAPHLDSVCVPVGKICIIRIVFQSLKVIAKGFYMGEYLSSNCNCQSIHLLHVKYLQKCSLLCKHNFSVDRVLIWRRTRFVRGRLITKILHLSERVTHLHIAVPTKTRFYPSGIHVLKKRGYLHCLRNVTLLPFSKYTKKKSI